MPHLCRAIGAVVTLGFASSVAAAAPNDPALACDQAAQTAAQATGVPLDVLRAVTRTETGRGEGTGLQPWPWTVNMEGAGVWFDTADQAQVYVFRHFQSGARSFDVGCFQINYKWHGAAFSSIEEMFDPVKNARYAAGFLKKLHAELGGWDRAVGAYHSRTQAYAQRYLKRYEAIHAALPETTPVAPDRAQATAARVNDFPLLKAQASGGTNGSLVPLTGGVGVSLFAPRSGS